MQKSPQFDSELTVLVTKSQAVILLTALIFIRFHFYPIFNIGGKAAG